ncbi:hypothetical protein L6164_007674 [Bauhinia variegata]|uniref:Uncharacterized protein n=1 Tax=Bauhinia variegata TaxID=167791 RepID=A0ACB9PE96_BAUVA|nr:hypothetical protein L6164_007674 [Bauhinia variegata]
MGNEDLNERLSLCGSGSRSENSKPQYGHGGFDSQPCNSEHTEDLLNRGILGKKGDSDCEKTHCISGAELEKDFVDNDSDMEIEDVNNLPVLVSRGHGYHIENNVDSGNGDSQPSDFVDKENKLENDKLRLTEGCVQIEDGEFLQEMSIGQDLVDSQSTLHVNKLTETVTVREELKGKISSVHAQSGCPSLRDESPNRSHKINSSSVSGVKRARVTVEHKSSAHVVYNSLTRASRQKLEELLRQWSEWHANHVSSKDPSEVLESGEETFFPALHVGLEKTSAVTFWMDNLTREEQNKGFTPLDDNSVPLYDRGYDLGLTSTDGSTSTIEGGLEIIETASRCFNCGSYSHSLKECPRPRDNVAVNNARKQHKSRRNQNSASRNPTRYYQDTPAGKYDGLRPGALDAETRQILGFGELDPPPWLDRMREIGYPPGYLDVDDDDQPSGIMIYADGESTVQEDGEIIKVDHSKPKKKMTVKFPGINAPIPENADERLWNSGPSNSYLSRNQQPDRLNYSTDHVNRGYHRELGLSRDHRDVGPPGDPYREQRLSRDHRHDGPPGDPFRNSRLSRDYRDDGPPGDPGYGSSMYSFHPRYGDSNHRPRDLLSDWSRSSLDDEGYRQPWSFHSLNYSTFR